jgi:hypothetical protein
LVHVAHVPHGGPCRVGVGVDVELFDDAGHLGLLLW